MEETKKVNFLKRVKIAIFDLEKYNIFLNEKLFMAFKYLLKFLVLLVVIFSIATTIELNQKIDAAFNYFSNEFPNFEYKEGFLTVENKVEAYDKKYDAKLIADTGEVSDEQLIKYQEKAKESGTSTILLKDKAIFETNGIAAEFVYTDLMQTIGIKEVSKEIVANQYNESGFMFKVGVVIFIYSFMVLFIQYFLVVLENILIVAIFGWIASKIIRLKLKFSKALTIAIYGLTLSNIINVAYSVVATFTTFEIKYFSLMYFIIGYIYMMAVIFMNKADLMDNDDAGEILQVVENINFVEVPEEDNKKETKKKKTKKDSDKKDVTEEKDSKEDTSIKTKKKTTKKGTETKSDNNKSDNNKSKKDNKDIKNKDNKE